MKITFYGAAQTVTGSCYVMEAAGARFAVDCGMFQGNQEIEKRNFDTEDYRPTELDFVLLTHAHIDHSGLLPRMAAHGFTGAVYCTHPTKDLATLMLEDSAHIQEMESKYKSQNNKRKGKSNDIEPLYTIEDAKKAASLMEGVEFDKPFSPHPGITVCFRYAGHILGASFLEITVLEEGVTTRFAFSGDLGRPGALLLPDAEAPAKCDWIFLESTYGDRDHKGEEDTLNELAAAIEHSYRAREKVIIPTFAVERAQEVLYSLIQLHDRHQIPADLPIFLDSPLAIRATEVFLKYADHLDTPDHKDISVIKDPRYNIHYSLSTEESQALNTMDGPAIILSASGMANAGRIKHHLKHNIWKPGASIVIVGYQAVGTLGRRIVDGASTVRIFQEDLSVQAKVFLIGGFSAHAGQSQLLDWMGQMAWPGLRVVLTHGELEKQEILAGLIKQRFGLDASIPEYLEEMDIEGGAVHITPAPEEKRGNRPVNWKPVRQDLLTRVDQVQELLDEAARLPWEQQIELRNRLLEINNDLLTLLTEM